MFVGVCFVLTLKYRRPGVPHTLPALHALGVVMVEDACFFFVGFRDDDGHDGDGDDDDADDDD